MDTPGYAWGVLKREKKAFLNGRWRLVAVGGGWWRLMAVGGGWWRLVAVGLVVPWSGP